MMRKHIYILTVSFLSFLLSSCLVVSQKTYTTPNKKAAKYMDAALKCYYDKDDKCAIKNCELAVKTDPKFGEPYLLLANIYREYKDFAKTEGYLLKAVEIDPKVFAEGFAALGDIYHEQFMFGKAYKAYTDYLKLGKIKKEETRLIYERKAYADFVADSLVSHPVPFEPKNMGPNINSQYSEYHPSLVADGSFLIYTVLEPGSSQTCATLNGKMEDFYQSTNTNDQWAPRKNSGKPLNTDCNEGAANLSPDGRYLFFAATTKINQYEGSMDIYYSERVGNTWSTPHALPAPVNTSAFESQPSFSSDGKTLYFTSTRGGGKGGNDIWRTSVNPDGTWNTPENLIEINTIGNEISAFIHPDNQTLYFASDGRYGVGGHDFYYSRIDENGHFSTPKNLGYPINTPYDERSLVISADGARGYFASKNIEGGLGEFDLYYFDLYGEARPVYTTYLKGHIYDDKTKEPLNASFELIDVETGKLIISSFSDEKTGDFLVSIPENRRYALNVSKTDYLFYSDAFDMKVEDKREPYLLDIGLKKIDLNIGIVLKNIFFDTDMYVLKPESYAELKKLIDLLTKNPTMKIEIAGHTDNQGPKAHNQVLSQNRAKAVYDYLVSAGIPASRLSYKGYGDTVPIADNNTEEGRALNRRTEFKVTGK
jgi:outer membrane protein OmpA-like peptidoglycan-associated protein/tetratricopeptide (TPR) repeat protein